MRRIYFVPVNSPQNDVAHQNNIICQTHPDLTLSLELWEKSYELVKSEPVGKILHRFWKHHFGSEAEMRLSGIDLKKLEAGIKKILKIDRVSAELREFFCDLERASVIARAKRYVMIVIAE